MASFEHELRLLYVVILNAVVLAGAWRLVRRAGVADLLQAALDSALLWIVVQYVTVGLVGLLGILSGFAISMTALVVSGFMWLPWRRAPSPPLEKPQSPMDVSIALACGGFILGYAAFLIVHLRYQPVMSIDALAYHLPAVAQWLQTGSLGLYEAWFYNPANVYSPLAGSIFAAWWIAPMGNDLLARFVQMPALVLIGLAVVQITRAMGARVSTACLIATAAVLMRPFVSQIVLPKDDLYLAGFSAAGVVGLSWRRGGDLLSPWRVGCAVGLMLATKYTSLLAAPILLLAIDAPLRARWKLHRWLIAIACLVVISAPWYARNWMLTANPLYPVEFLSFDGMFRTARSEMLGSAQGVWQVLTAMYHSIPPMLFAVMLALWLAGVVSGWRRVLRDPLLRIIALGPVVGAAAFVLTSPYPEIRFLYPSLLLVICGWTGVAIGWPRREWWFRIALVAIVLWGALTAFRLHAAQASVMSGLVLATVGVGMYWLDRAMRLPASYRIGASALLAGVIAMAVYVFWRPYVRVYREAPYLSWRSQYGPTVDAWKFVREDLPPEAVIAYTNTYLTYPLFGFNLNRKVVYAPTRRGLNRYVELPPLPQTATDANMRRQIEQITFAEPDLPTWLGHLRDAKVTHLLVVKPEQGSDYVTASPPELEFVRQMPETFLPVFDNSAATVFAVRRVRPAN